MQIFFMVNKLELSDFDFNIATKIRPEVFWDWKQGKPNAPCK